jgi:hypothetical protein
MPRLPEVLRTTSPLGTYRHGCPDEAYR